MLLCKMCKTSVRERRKRWGEGKKEEMRRERMRWREEIPAARNNSPVLKNLAVSIISLY